MSRIRILPDNPDPAVPKHVPKAAEMNKVVPRFQAPGGKPGLPLEKSFNRQGGKR
jgi:hypothetical protein